MVALVHAATATTAPVASGNWRDLLRGAYETADIEALGATESFVREAAGDARSGDGEPLAARGVGSAAILSALKLDPATLHAALLLPLAQAHLVGADALAARFGAEVAALVAGFTRMDDIRAAPRAA
ncbi:MAG: HD domain-containing protein, partial [Burkholderiales bacterium]